MVPVCSSAALIAAACAANARRVAEDRLISHSSNSGESCYQILFKMYVRFEPRYVIKFREPSQLFNSDRLDKLDRVETDCCTFCAQHMFRLSADECANKPYKYVRKNKDTYTSSSVWEPLKEDAMNKYIEAMKDKYNVELSKSDLDYETAYYWEVLLE